MNEKETTFVDVGSCPNKHHQDCHHTIIWPTARRPVISFHLSRAALRELAHSLTSYVLWLDEIENREKKP